MCIRDRIVFGKLEFLHDDTPLLLATGYDVLSSDFIVTYLPDGVNWPILQIKEEILCANRQ